MDTFGPDDLPVAFEAAGGYAISGELRIHTADGMHDVLAGQAFHVEPGHAPEALSACLQKLTAPAQGGVQQGTRG